MLTPKENILDVSIGRIAAEDLRKAQIFKKYGLDFCCGGKKTVREACAEKEVDITKVEQDLQLAEMDPVTTPVHYNDWSIDFLVDYIVNVHHGYVKRTLPELVASAAKVARVHGDRHPELLIIYQLVEEVNGELSAHLVKEENILFPYIKDLVASAGKTKPAAPFGTIEAPVSMMEREHEIAGKVLQEIRELANNYSLPGDACVTYSVFYRMLDEFENDLYTHVHLENNILFPKAIAIEKAYNA